MRITTRFSRVLGVSRPNLAGALLDALNAPGEEVLTSSMLFADIQRRFIEAGVLHTPLMAFAAGAQSGGFVFFLR